jgi:transposase InsO family protein
MMATNLLNPPEGQLHHSDRGGQYASHAYQALLRKHGMVCSMSRKGNCWGSAPTERFLSSLKREWLTGGYPFSTDDLEKAARLACNACCWIGKSRNAVQRTA